jgi:hypothetical protein
VKSGGKVVEITEWLYLFSKEVKMLSASIASGGGSGHGTF